VPGDDDIEVLHVDGLNGTPAARLATQGWLEMVERGLGEPGDVINIHWSQKALVAVVRNGMEHVPAGVLTYEVVEATKSMFLSQAYVVPEFRGRGVYTAMFDAAVAKAIEAKVARINLGTHPRNEAMRMIARKHGGVETAVYITFDVPQA
jgi:GNAT superfamily N-acetyltransferase